MLRYLIFPLLSLLALTSCGPRNLSTNYAAIDRGRQAEFDSRTIEWTVPRSLQIQAERAIKDILNDPESARFRHDFVSKGIGSTVGVCGAVNSRNRMGGYQGFTRFFVEIVDGRVINADILERNGTSIRLAENCGFTDGNDLTRSMAERRRPGRS